MKKVLMAAPDWALLREQKLALLYLIKEDKMNVVQSQKMTGLIHFIDSVQDAAVDDNEEFSEIEVFGKEPTLIDAQVLFKEDIDRNDPDWMIFCVEDFEDVRGRVNDDEIFYYGDDPRKFVGEFMNEDFKIISARIHY